MAELPEPPSHEPKRRRGRLRVEAIVEGATEVFAEKGFDTATMTEIAARSKTAIGSLYRFFPTKEAIGEVIIARHLERLGAELSALAERARDLTPADLADALVDLKLAMGTEKAAAVAFAEARGMLAKARQQVTSTMRSEVAKMLMAANGGLSVARARVIAVVVVHLIHTVGAIQEEPGAGRKRALAEIRDLCRLYLSSR